MDANDPRHAYAVLGLTPPVTDECLKRRYKELVARWHPDRFQSDPEGRAEAEIMLRNINVAYQVAKASASAEAPASSAAETTDWKDAPSPNASGVNPDPAESGPQQPPDPTNFIELRLDRAPPVRTAVLVERLLSFAWVGGYVGVAYILHPAAMRRPAYFVQFAPWVLALWMVWKGSNAANPISRWGLRLIGWFYLVAPAVAFAYYALR